MGTDSWFEAAGSVAVIHDTTLVSIMLARVTASGFRSALHSKSTRHLLYYEARKLTLENKSIETGEGPGCRQDGRPSSFINACALDYIWRQSNAHIYQNIQTLFSKNLFYVLRILYSLIYTICNGLIKYFKSLNNR